MRRFSGMRLPHSQLAGVFCRHWHPFWLRQGAGWCMLGKEVQQKALESSSACHSQFCRIFCRHWHALWLRQGAGWRMLGKEVQQKASESSSACHSQFCRILCRHWHALWLRQGAGWRPGSAPGPVKGHQCAKVAVPFEEVQLQDTDEHMRSTMNMYRVHWFSDRASRPAMMRQQ
jgi:hypothetical protein